MRALVFVCALMGVSAAAAETQVPLTIGGLLAQGWEVAGFTSADANRTSLILFKHAGAASLVQCSTHYEPTRTPMAAVNCYELH